MKKLHPNTFVTINAKWPKGKNNNEGNAELNFKLKDISSVEKFKNTTFNETFYNVTIDFEKLPINSSATEVLKHGENYRMHYQIDEETYHRLKECLSEVDWNLAERNDIEKIIKESVKEEMVKSKMSSAIDSLEV